MDIEIKEPHIHSSVDLYRKAVDAKNASQKADLGFQGPDTGKKLSERLEATERKMKVLEERLERLEALNDVTV